MGYSIRKRGLERRGRERVLETSERCVGKEDGRRRQSKTGGNKSVSRVKKKGEEGRIM